MKKVVVETVLTVTINKDIKIQSLIDAHITYTGQASGKSYVWDRAGAIVEIDEQDVPDLLSKRGKKSCCGQEPNRIFQLAI